MVALNSSVVVVLGDTEKTQLQRAKQGCLANPDSATRHLIRCGLLEIEDGGFQPRGLLWSRWVAERALDGVKDPQELPSAEPRLVSSDLALAVELIEELVADINDTSFNIGRGEVFQCSNQDTYIYRDLRRQAIDSDEFVHFALAMYNLVFERTQGPKLVKVVSSNGNSIIEDERYRALERLPKSFRRERKIVRVVDIVRHHFGKAHNTRISAFGASGSAIPISDVLDEYLGNHAHPANDQYLPLQAGMLRDITTYLVDLRDSLRKEAQKPLT